MAPKQRPVKFATVLLPLVCFAVERRVKNTSAYLNRILPYIETSAAQVECDIASTVGSARKPVASQSLRFI